MNDRAPAPLVALLQERFGELSPKQRAVGRIFLSDPTFVSFASVADVAARADVDPATVVRTCQSLGYRGWSELQEEVRSEVARRRTFLQRVERLDGGDGDLTNHIFAAAARNVNDTYEHLDLDALKAAARAIDGSDLVLVASGGVSHGSGHFLTSSLQILGHRAVFVSGVGDGGSALGSFGADDVLVAISMWRYLRSTIQMLEAAREVGATTIAVTDTGLSPAAMLADHVLVAHTTTAGPRLGQAGIVTLLETIIAEVATLDPARATEAAGRANRMYFAGNVLGEPRPGSVEGDMNVDREPG